ncbi:MAG TPA: hypothetical protein VFE30_09745 [Anaeromyxobacteraceae bacterium]|jgi:hypothetical protein|nr:hypothetical protein [Anaeromyxobacteraceae bacterium]
MGKALLLSVIVAFIAIPALGWREPSPVKALKRAVFFVVGFVALYYCAIRFALPRIW